MKKTLFIAALVSFLFVQCGEKSDPYLIVNGSIGNLTKDIQIRQIDSLFANDSIVKLSRIEEAIGTQGDVEIYEKGGGKLLLVSPEIEDDPNSVISYVQVFDERYRTAKGLHKGSTFKDLKDNYTIADIESTISSIVVFMDESDVFITINKDQLPENLRYDPSIKIEPSQIPDGAKFKYFMVGWDQ